MKWQKTLLWVKWPLPEVGAPEPRTTDTPKYYYRNVLNAFTSVTLRYLLLRYRVQWMRKNPLICIEQRCSSVIPKYCTLSKIIFQLKIRGGMVPKHDMFHYLIIVSRKAKSHMKLFMQSRYALNLKMFEDLISLWRKIMYVEVLSMYIDANPGYMVSWNRNLAGSVTTSAWRNCT